MKTIYKLTRDLSGDSELIHLSTNRETLADLMRADINKWTVPVAYTTEITYAFDNFFQEVRAETLKEAKLALYEAAHGFPDTQLDAIVFRMAARVVEDLQS